MPELTEGQKAFQANIDAMRKLGEANVARRAEEAKQHTTDHLAVMNARAIAAEAAAEKRRLDGIARRNEHNARLKIERAERLSNNERIKGISLRAA